MANATAIARFGPFPVAGSEPARVRGILIAVEGEEREVVRVMDQVERSLRQRALPMRSSREVVLTQRLGVVNRRA